MAKKKKNLKQKLSEITYSKPSMDKQMTQLKKNFNEVVAILNEKKKP